MNNIDTNKVIDGGLSAFSKGVALTDGELQLNIAVPSYMAAGDALGAFTEETATEGYYTVTVPYRDLDQSTWIHGRVLLIEDRQRGFMPAVIMPDPKGRTGFIRIASFDQPYDPVNGLDEGQLLALSFETTTKEAAGFGSHEVKSQFEGGHFAVAALATSLDDRRSTVHLEGHSGAHGILDGSVATDFSRANLTGTSTPLPRVKEINVSMMPQGARFIAKWHEKMTDGVKPVVAAHPQAAQVLLGNVIERLGEKGLDEVGNYITAVRVEK